MTVLQDLSQADVWARFEAMEAELAATKARLAKATKPRAMVLKVSKAGAISVYGFGKWPVTLYREQMERLLAGATEIREFIEANADQLSVKG